MASKHNNDKKFNYTVERVPADHRRDWVVIINGAADNEVAKIDLVSIYGLFRYGLRPEGYDGWVYYPPAGGGAVTLLYAWCPHGNLYIGLLQETRRTMSTEPVWCVMGGFVDPGETHAMAQSREADEEGGIDTTHAVRLNGLCFNPDSSFFVMNVQ